MVKTCVWHDQEKRYVLNSMVIGHFANWAVRQSPDDQPKHLSSGIFEFAENLTIGDDEGGECNCAFLREQIDVAIKKSPTVVSWNDTPQGVDFIDLDALAQNIAHSVWLETLYDNEIVIVNLPREEQSVRPEKNQGAQDE